MPPLNVLVVGASIAGPATAYWLSRIGARVTVIERFSQLRTGGQAVDVRTVGVSVMRETPGMEALVCAKSTKEEGVSFVREDGRPYGVIRATGNPDQQSLISEFEIYRGHLARILVGLTQDNKQVNYIFNEQIASIRQKSSGDGPVTVKFTNGTTTSDYDLVVACDGTTSRTRAMGLSCRVRDHVVPTNNWAAYFSAKEDYLHGSLIGQGYSAPGGRFISIGSDPAGFSRILLMAVNQQHEAINSYRNALDRGDAATRQHIEQYFKGSGWRSSAVLKDMMVAEDFYTSEIVQVKVPSLYHGRVVMVGDAGYATGPTGGGTSLALAGAYMLAGEIGKHGGDLTKALVGYEQQMRPLIKEMQKIPPFATTVLAPQTRTGIWLRNNVFAFIAWTGLVEYAQRLFGSAFASTDTYPLPEYKWKA